MEEKIIKPILSSLVIFFIILSTAVLSFAQGNGVVRRIVVFDQDVVNESAKSALVNKFGGTVIKPLNIVNGMSVALPLPAVEALSKSAGVLRVDVDAEVHALGKPSGKPGNGGGKEPPPQPAQILPYGIDRIDAEYAHSAGFTGQGVNVAVIDTGIDYTHPDLANNYKGGINIINPKKSPKDDHWHGTHVAGTIAAEDNAIGVVGVAPDANLYAVKSLDRNGSGFVSDVIAGIEWCVANNIDIANMSLGSNSDIQALHDACDAASSAGLILVCAAGNDGGAVDYPGAYSSTIAVAATDINDNRAPFSSFGAEVDIAAPGVGVLSTVKGGGYGYADGTSMATPHVTGTLALNPNADIYTTADDLGPVGADDLYGSGLVDAAEAATGIVDLGDDLP